MVYTQSRRSEVDDWGTFILYKQIETTESVSATSVWFAPFGDYLMTRALPFHCLS